LLPNKGIYPLVCTRFTHEPSSLAQYVAPAHSWRITLFNFIKRMPQWYPSSLWMARELWYAYNNCCCILAIESRLMSIPESKLPYAVAAIALVVWAATPAITRIAVNGIDSLAVGLLRTTLAAVILFPLALIMRLPLPKGRAGWLALAVSALMAFVGYTLLFTVAIQLTSTAHVALIVTTAPIFTSLIGFALQRRAPARLWWLGAGIALAGEAVLVAVRTPGETTATLEGDLLAGAAVLFLSAGYVAGSYLATTIGAWSATAWSVSIAGALMVPVILTQIDLDSLVFTAATRDSWLAVGYLAVFTSIVGYATWYWALGRGGVERIAPIQFVQPLMSVALGVTFLSEPVTPPLLVALVAIFVGVTVIRRSQRPVHSPSLPSTSPQTGVS
jgi:drug/metabolite transporter (DMT)-like permease